MFVTWNGSRFDLPLLEDLIDIKIPNDQHIDGMLLMKMLAHGKTHSFSMESACDFFKTIQRPDKPKGTKEEILEWYNTAPLEELADYLHKDLRCTEHLLDSMLPQVSKFPNMWSRALKLEQKVARIVEDQCRYGVNLDYELAKVTHSAICDEMDRIEKEWALFAPNIPITPSALHYPPKQQFKKDGTPSKLIENYIDKYGWKLVSFATGGSYYITNGRGKTKKLPLTEPLETEKPLLLSNTTEVKEFLMDKYGWKPVYWNYSNGKKTTPRFSDKVTGSECPDLARLAKSSPAVDSITEWLMLRSRKNVIKSDNGTGWLPMHLEGSLCSDADTLGANTARFTHKRIANVPRITSPWGGHMRKMLCARHSYEWVGWDANSLEAFCEAHWVWDLDRDYAKELIEGDIHTKNLFAISLLKDRDQAKTLKYALTYGAQPGRVSSILNCSAVAGQQIYDDFWDNNRALFELRNRLKHEFKHKGSIATIDGREIQCRSEHSLVNALFQSTGAIIMKYGMVMMEDYVRGKMGLTDYEARGLIKYHDEEIWECLPEYSEKILKVGCASVSAAAKNLELNVPLAAEGKIGKNWADIH